MADDLSKVSTIGIALTGEALRGLKHIPDRRERGPMKSKPSAEDNQAEESLAEDEQPESEEHQLDVDA